LGGADDEERTEQQIQIGDELFHTRRTGDVLHGERESDADLDWAKATVGSFNFYAQLQQRPVSLDGGIIKWSWFQSFGRI
jgi:hypothetical protein